jgi:hypothetical protein
VTATLLAATGGSRTLWYLTRGSGAVTLALLTLSMCLGIVGMQRWRSTLVPRSAVAALHRNLTLLALVFLSVHVVTAVADTYAPIGLKDVFLPFTSQYRPLWLGLGALACDLLLALVLTSLLRARIGHRTWRLAHWLAYACWPLALVHALGTGSDPRAGWLQLLAAVSVAAVLAAVAVRLARGTAEPSARLAAAGAVLAATLLAAAWYRTGPDAHGWAARAGTPAALLRHTTAVTSQRAAAAAPALPTSFSGRLQGTISEGSDSNGLVDIHLDGSVAGGVPGELRVVLQGIPLDGGGVNMTASGVAFAARGTPLYEGQIVALEGTRVTARVASPSGQALLLSLMLQLSPGSSTLTGTIHASAA